MSENIFKLVGDRFGGFLGIDEDTRNRHHLKWARICVKSSDTPFLATVELIVQDLIFRIPLWVGSGLWVEECNRKSNREGDRSKEGDHRTLAQNSNSRINEMNLAPSISKMKEQGVDTRDISVPKIFNNLNLRV